MAETEAFPHGEWEPKDFRPEDPLYRKGLEALSAHVTIVNARGSIILANHAWTAFGESRGAKRDPDVAVGANYLAVCRKAATQDPLAQKALHGIEAVLEGRLGHFQLEYPCHGPGERRWYLMTVAPLDPDERAGAVISHTDITERIAAELERQASDARYRAIYEHAPVGIAELTPAGRWLRVNDRFCRIVGYEFDELESKLASEFTHADDVEAEGAHLEALRAGDASSFSLEKRMHRKDGSYVWVHATTSCARAADGAVDYYVVVIEDISERKQAEQRQQTLVHEVAHRGKNLLAVIQSLASRSLRGDMSLEQARESFEGRLQALSKTYSTLTHEAFSGARLDAVLNNELSAFGGRAHCEGPGIVLSVKAAQTFALVVHELATNAAKYGALSGPDGRVIVVWNVVEALGEERLQFLWREEGGPKVKPPEHTGFGSSLITGVAKAEFGCRPELTYAETGVTYRFDALLKKLGALPSDSRVRNKLKSEIVCSLYDEWARQRGAAKSLPRLGGFDWSRFAATGALTIAKIESDGGVHFVQVGRALVEEYGRPLQERDLTDEERDGLLDPYKRCAREGGPCQEYMRFDFGDGQPLIFERLLVPFSVYGDKTVTHIAGVVVFGGQTRARE